MFRSSISHDLHVLDPFSQIIDTDHIQYAGQLGQISVIGRTEIWVVLFYWHIFRGSLFRTRDMYIHHTRLGVYGCILLC
jgi:hypothetical protein